MLWLLLVPVITLGVLPALWVASRGHAARQDDEVGSQIPPSDTVRILAEENREEVDDARLAITAAQQRAAAAEEWEQTVTGDIDPDQLTPAALIATTLAAVAFIVVFLAAVMADRAVMLAIGLGTATATVSGAVFAAWIAVTGHKAKRAFRMPASKPPGRSKRNMGDQREVGAQDGMTTVAYPGVTRLDTEDVSWRTAYVQFAVWAVLCSTAATGLSIAAAHAAVATVDASPRAARQLCADKSAQLDAFAMPDPADVVELAEAEAARAQLAAEAAARCEDADLAESELLLDRVFGVGRVLGLALLENVVLAFLMPRLPSLLVVAAKVRRSAAGRRLDAEERTLPPAQLRQRRAVAAGLRRTRHDTGAALDALERGLPAPDTGQSAPPRQPSGRSGPPPGPLPPPTPPTPPTLGTPATPSPPGSGPSAPPADDPPATPSARRRQPLFGDTPPLAS